nr:N-6 DNA methylase [Thiohalocapsa sp.]
MEKKQLPHLLCTTNLMLHCIEVPSTIEQRNTLQQPSNSWTKRDRVDCAISNPPFGSIVRDTVGFNQSRLEKLSGVVDNGTGSDPARSRRGM